MADVAELQTFLKTTVDKLSKARCYLVVVSNGDGVTKYSYSLSDAKCSADVISLVGEIENAKAWILSDLRKKEGK